MRVQIVCAPADATGMFSVKAKDRTEVSKEEERTLTSAQMAIVFTQGGAYGFSEEDRRNRHTIISQAMSQGEYHALGPRKIERTGRSDFQFLTVSLPQMAMDAILSQPLTPEEQQNEELQAEGLSNRRTSSGTQRDCGPRLHETARA